MQAGHPGGPLTLRRPRRRNSPEGGDLRISGLRLRRDDRGVGPGRGRGGGGGGVGGGDKFVL